MSGTTVDKESSVMPSGWEELDEDITVPGIVAGNFELAA